MEQSKKTVPFSTVVSALLDEKNIFPPSYLHHFSDISRQDLEALKKAWPNVNPDRRATLLEDLEELAEADTLVSFDDLSLFALTDTDPRVRATAIRLLWEAQDLKLVPIYSTLLEQDEDVRVRAAAASGLGIF
ncbi:MAG TPA: HEAT repeat domain-containing protein, partial [Anaerolineaceae bacterium]|nr:HEAT repeat domain-containing protein [Anaerolineaceae bacterium]